MAQENIHLINCDEQILNKILEGSKALADTLQLNVPSPWTEFGHPIFLYSLAKVTHNPNVAKWWTYLPIIKETNTLIGSCGFKGPPNANGEVEIGYEVALNYRRRGYATEIARQLVTLAFEHSAVQHVIAHTLAEENPSTKVLGYNNFKFVTTIESEEDGKVWQWRCSQ